MKFGRQIVIFDKFYKKLSTATDYESKVKILKEDYPTVYVGFLQVHDQCYEVAKFVSGCMKMKDVGPIEYAQYIHGGIIPTLEFERAAGEFKEGKVILKLTLVQ